MNEYQDEVSLRDLYLIFKRGFAIIAILTVLAGVAAFIYASVRPDSFEAQATVLVTPTPERRGDDAGAAIIRRTNVNYATYESVAFSQRVLDNTIMAAGLEADELDNFTDRLTLANLAGGDASSQLIVGHTATATDADEAAELANIWSRETIKVVTATMQAILAPIIENNTATVTELASNLDALEEQWRAFQDRNDTALLQAELTSYTNRNAQASERIDSLERDLAGNQARQAAIAEALAALAGTTGQPLGADGTAVTALLESRGLLSPAAASELGAFMQTTGSDSELLRLVLGLELQSLVGEAAAIQTNLDTTAVQQAEYAAAAAERRGAIAGLSRESSEIERELRIAETLYTNSLDLEPVLTYVSDVLATNVRMLDSAAAPLRPESGGRLMITLIAAVVGGLLATVFVFLRAAVAAPEPGKA